MEMNSRVGRALATSIRPLLRDQGFDKFSGRHAWRRSDLTVDLVTLPAVGYYNAGVLDCTSFSFTGAVGVYYPALDIGDPVEWPRDHHLTFSGFLGKRIRQPFFHDYGPPWVRDPAHVWFVKEDGTNLEDVVEDVHDVVVRHALPFIDHLDDPRRATAWLEHEQGRNTDYDTLGVFAPGLDSPANARLRAGLSRLVAM